MREKFLKNLAHWHTSHPWKMLTVVIVLTIILGGFSSQLNITMRTEDLLPEGDKRVAQFNMITEEFATATNLVIVAQGEEIRLKESVCSWIKPNFSAF